MDPLKYLSICLLWLLISHSYLVQLSLSYSFKGQEIRQAFWARTEVSMEVHLEAGWRTGHIPSFPASRGTGSTWLVTSKEQ